MGISNIVVTDNCARIVFIFEKNICLVFCCEGSVALPGVMEFLMLITCCFQNIPAHNYYECSRVTATLLCKRHSTIAFLETRSQLLGRHVLGYNALCFCCVECKYPLEIV